MKLESSSPRGGRRDREGRGVVRALGHRRVKMEKEKQAVEVRCPLQRQPQ